MAYLYSSRFFAFDPSTLFLLRKNFPYQEIPLTTIKAIRFCKGTDNKRPVISLVIGGCIIALAVYLAILMIIRFDGGAEFGNMTRYYIRSMFSLLLVVGFLGGIGSLLIYHALPIHSVIEFDFYDGQRECFSLANEKAPEAKVDLLLKLAAVVGKEKISRA